jgi:hypothetical protein
MTNELNTAWGDAGYKCEGDWVNDLMDAIDLASDQDQMTWLIDGEGKRIAAIVPVESAETALRFAEPGTIMAELNARRNHGG